MKTIPNVINSGWKLNIWLKNKWKTIGSVWVIIVRQLCYILISGETDSSQVFRDPNAYENQNKESKQLWGHKTGKKFGDISDTEAVLSGAVLVFHG
jgi:hypothetical protein